MFSSGKEFLFSNIGFEKLKQKSECKRFGQTSQIKRKDCPKRGHSVSKKQSYTGKIFWSVQIHLWILFATNLFVHSLKFSVQIECFSHNISCSFMKRTEDDKVSPKEKR